MNGRNTEQQIQMIIERNKRVEQDKAWEVSVTRRAFIAAVTYLIACYYLWLIAVPGFYLHAAVPAGGYILSTMSLPWVKRWWGRKNI